MAMAPVFPSQVKLNSALHASLYLFYFRSWLAVGQAEHHGLSGRLLD